jgi:uncharacterized protein
MGSAIATKLARENKDRTDALVLDGPISSFGDIAAAYAPEEQKAMIRQYVTSPYYAEEDIRSVKAPKLIIASRGDKSVPFEQAEKIYRNAEEPKELLLYEGDHLEALRLQPDKIADRIKTFLKL